MNEAASAETVDVRPAGVPGWIRTDQATPIGGVDPHALEAHVYDMDIGALDLTRIVPTPAGVLEVTVTLREPQWRIRVRLPDGDAGRAEAVMDKRSWAAKHYWREEPGVMVYEFDEPLPAGPVTVRIPLARRVER